VRATDAGARTATRALTLVVNPPALSITTTLLPAGTAGTAYNQALAATGGTPPYSWTVATGTLPAGLTLSSAGVLSGTPAGEGSATFTVRVTDAAARTTTQALTLVVNPPALVITTTSLPAGTAGTAYSQALAATGGTTPYSWTVAAGTLPAGLTLSSAGVLSGTPTDDGSATFTVRVTDAAARTTTQALALVVNPPPVVITTTTLAAGTSGTAYNQALAATGGTTPYSWTVATGTLPAGLTLSSAGVLSGTPTTAGTVTFTVRVTDTGARAATQALTVTVNAGPIAQVVWVQQPGTVARNAVISPAPSVRLLDAAGNTVTATVAVTMSITNPTGRAFTTSSTTTVNSINGVATFANLVIGTTDRSFRIRASAGTLRSPESANFRVR
jgi:hypothetical protein